ncbi:Lysine-specific demethylase JMJ703 [Cocos nucifera]|uniref:Lysine-specific demethylase JMJ703 n=1 Tax=Cocos nucifera TaxID=13894 RepID=A0A8K0N437_COCNU|nr:Lysine-specific demethylase JMJ703 [Cocos nucifera]
MERKAPKGDRKRKVDANHDKEEDDSGERRELVEMRAATKKKDERGRKAPEDDRRERLTPRRKAMVGSGGRQRRSGSRSGLLILVIFISQDFVEIVNELLNPNRFRPTEDLWASQEHRLQENAVASALASNSIQAPEDAESGITDEGKFRKSLRHRPWVDCRRIVMDFLLDLLYCAIDVIYCLRKSIRFVAYQKGLFGDVLNVKPVKRPVLDEAPVFYPNEEEFQDTIKYIASIRPVAESYGICRIVPPPSWAPPCPLKEKDVWQNSKFVTRIQQVDKLQNRDSVKKTCRIHSIMKRKRRKLLRMGAECTNNIEKLVEPNRLGRCNNAERFGFEPGPDYTLESFQKYAEDFKQQYFCIRDMDVDIRSAQLEPSVENIEGEYWRIVEKPTEEIEVLYGADLETRVVGSGFPKASSPPSSSDFEERYVKSGWNLNNFARLPGSLLAFENGEISGVLVPWLYIGMCFSSFCWHVEDHHLYSMNYLHWGAPKVWYGVPGKEAVKLEVTMKKHLADLFEEQPDLLHNLVTQFSPSILKSEGVPVYRCVQCSGEFVITFPRAYHSGFNCGFNCAEAVNVAPIDWLPHGQNAVELYSEQRRKISISHDKLLLGAAREAVRAQWNILFLGKNTLDNLRWKEACGLDGILAKALKARIEMEHARREYLSSSQSRKMDADFDCNCERECIVCHYDLHLSAAGCLCSPDRFACLNHAKQLCSCAWSTRFFLFHYEISELNVLLDALGGKLSAVHRWGLSDLGLSLSSHVAKEKTQKHAAKTYSENIDQREKGQAKQSSSNGRGKNSDLSQEVMASLPQPTFVAVPKEREKINTVYSTCKIANPSSLHQGTKATTIFPTKDSYLQGRSSSEVYQSLQSDKRLKGSYSSARSISSHENSQGSMLNIGTPQTTSSEKNSVAYPALVPEGKHLSNSGKFVCSTGKNTLANDGDVKNLSGAGYEGAGTLLLDNTKKQPVLESSEIFARLTNSDDKVNFCSSQKDLILVTPETNASVTSEKDVSLLSIVGKSDSMPNPVYLSGRDGKTQSSSLQNQQFVRSDPQNTSHCKNSVAISNARQNLEFFIAKEKHEFVTTNIRGHLWQSGSIKRGGIKGDKSGPDFVHNLIDKTDSITASSSFPTNSTDRSNCPQKGPRLAKVVRRMNCSVEPLEHGVVLSGKLWSTGKAIFPKGFRSRVRYFSVLDPTQMCNYMSEILDAGLLGPLFMVSVEQSPSEVFFHVSATKCWDMVRERVNQEIRRQHNLGIVNLPPLQPPGSLDGLDMFGLTSPKIIQAIEAIDRNRVCSEYWRCRPEAPTPTASVMNQRPSAKEVGTDAALGRLLKKANPEELQTLHGILSNDHQNSKQEIIEILEEEIENRSRAI